MLDTDFSLQAFDKPAGVTTHRSQSSNDPFFWGYAEYCSYKTKQVWQPVHRLDRDTSGIVLMAGNLATKRRLGILFAAHDQRKIKKSYLLLTNHEVKLLSNKFALITETSQGIQVESHIEKREKAFCTFEPKPENPVNAITVFRLVQQQKPFSLWEAFPITGKPHQIRLHAQALGIPILGDREHGGNPHARVMLHAHEIQISDPLLGNHEFRSAPPPLFHQLEWLHDPIRSRLAHFIDRRRRLFPNSNCLRWIHTTESELACDQFGTVLYFYWFGAEQPNARVLEQVKFISETIGVRVWFLRWMQNRGRQLAHGGLWRSHEDLATRWQASEGKFMFEFRADSGLSPGLFLDQRQNRVWLAENCGNQRILNLFCYSGGFSVAAAHGGANQVVSVDLSKANLDWTRANLRLNGFSDSEKRFEFWPIDVREFLKRAQKNKRQFDVIICDPPSFSRGAGGVFRVEREIRSLITEIATLLAPEGRILFCTNYEKWSRLDFLSELEKSVAHQRLNVLPSPPQDWDFELPGQEPILKSAILARN